MMLAQHDPTVDRLLNSAGFINGLLMAATAAAAATVLIKWLGVRDPSKPTTVKVFGVDIPIGKAWIIFMIFTVGHIYVAYVFRMDCLEVLKQSAEVKIDAWRSLTGASLLFFHGLVSRLKSVVVNGQRIFIMDNSDPTTWLVHGVAILVFAAVVRYRNATWATRIGTIMAPLFVVVFNWPDWGRMGHHCVNAGRCGFAFHGGEMMAN